jgi:hypothetical protein
LGDTPASTPDYDTLALLEFDLAAAPSSTDDEDFEQDFSRRLDEHRNTYQAQVGQLHQVHTDVRQVVERFMTLVAQDQQLRQVFQADDLSDADRDMFKGKVETLEKDLGIGWGRDPEKTPHAESALNTRVLLSGMMI